MRSDKQIEASRRNGALSRGPLSIDGKAASSRNATTHGLSAHDVLLRHESLEQFEQLLQHIENHVSRYSRATDRAIRRLQQLRQFHPSNPTVPPEDGLEKHFLGNEPKKA